MQLYALDLNNSLVSAKQAVKQLNYTCIECQSVVRVRAGLHRQVHFYHLTSSPSCRQAGKTMPHLHLQALLHQLCPGKCTLENAFKEVNRIADVVWWDQKLIFEIQCSPITAQEVMERNRDYNSIGFQCIWVLSDKQFNQHRLSAAEYYLQKHPHYYSDMDAEGIGHIYDRLYVERSKQVTVNFDELKTNQKMYGSNCEELNKRLRHWPIHFKGDLIDQWLLNPQEQAQTKSPFVNPIKNLYRILFRLLLEKLCG